MNGKNSNDISKATASGDVAGSKTSRGLTTRTKVVTGATSAALLAFGLMLAGNVDNPVFFRSPDPDPSVVAEVEADAALATQETPQARPDIADSGDDLLVGQPGRDVLLGGVDELSEDGEAYITEFDGIDTTAEAVPGDAADDDWMWSDEGFDSEVADQVDAVDELSPPPDAPPRLASICVSIVHGDTTSDVNLAGDFGDPQLGGWIRAAGPTFNFGETVDIPVTGGVFDAPLPIVTYDDHRLTVFELGPDGSPTPVDLLPSLANGPGTVFSVGPAEGPVFGNECIDIAPDDPSALDQVVEGEQSDVVEPGAEVSEGAEGADGAVVTDESLVETESTGDLDEAMFEQQRLTEEADRLVDTFLRRFVDDHVNRDVAHLQGTLHPSIRLAYGDEVCTEYIARTAGSLTGATVIDVGVPQSLDMNTPSGQINFPEAIPFTVEFEVTDGSTFINEAHLPIHDGEAKWLTTCGVEAP